MKLFTRAVLAAALLGAVSFLQPAEAVSMGGFVGFVPGTLGGCMKARLCCPGKDHTCSVYETPKEGGKARKCFCDSECLTTKDCCHDYQHYCQPIDCEVEEKWQKWSKCSVPCGMGTKNRTRRVIQYPRNGGKECANTVQQIACDGVECRFLRTATSYNEKMTEVAQILPTSFARWRSDTSDRSKADTRRNPPFNRRRQRSFNGRSKSTERYCVSYRLTEVSRMCKGHDDSPASNWTRDLITGKVICVECQPTASRATHKGRCNGDGILERETRWAAMTVSGCKGKWTMISAPEQCQCLDKHHHHQPQQPDEMPIGNDFIFI